MDNHSLFLMTRPFLNKEQIYPLIKSLHQTHIVPQKCDVDSWHEQLCGDAASREHHRTIITTKAVELRLIKEDASSEHDYFIAKILHADSGTRYLRIERFGKEYKPATAGQRSPVQASPSSEPFNPRPAADLISTVGGWPSRGRVLEIAYLRHADVTLLDLAIVAWVVRNNDDQYRLLEKQCYWSSDMVMRVLEDAYGFNVDRTEEYNSGGTWLGVPLCTNMRRSLLPLSDKFREERDKVYDQRQIRLTREQREAERREREEAAEAKGMEKGKEERQQLLAKIAELQRTNLLLVLVYLSSVLLFPNHYNVKILLKGIRELKAIDRKL
ncbi:hypothetical protein BU17DRAFT_66243 [Hysterangium stoloniferum]|nr:hypothetical protein BU17DRAFT_66243 [Hysterangium stoloniferum]